MTHKRFALSPMTNSWLHLILRDFITIPHEKFYNPFKSSESMKWTFWKSSIMFLFSSWKMSANIPDFNTLEKWFFHSISWKIYQIKHETYEHMGTLQRRWIYFMLKQFSLFDIGEVLYNNWIVFESTIPFNTAWNFLLTCAFREIFN